MTSKRMALPSYFTMLAGVGPTWCSAQDTALSAGAGLWGPGDLEATGVWPEMYMNVCLMEIFNRT